MTEALESTMRKILDSVGRGRGTPDLAATWRELGFDSLDLLELITTAEDEFGVAVPDRIVVRLHTPAALLAQIAEQLAGGKASDSASSTNEAADPVDDGLVLVDALVDGEHRHGTG